MGPLWPHLKDFDNLALTDDDRDPASPYRHYIYIYLVYYQSSCILAAGAPKKVMYHQQYLLLEGGASQGHFAFSHTGPGLAPEPGCFTVSSVAFLKARQGNRIRFQSQFRKVVPWMPNPKILT